MPDIALISSALSGVNSAINLVKTLKEAKFSIEEAAFKLQLAELMDHLADSKSQIANIKFALLEKDEIISQLEKRIKKILSEEKPMLNMGCYFFEGDENPYCTGCWDKNMEKIRTVTDVEKFHIRKCPSCKTSFHIHGK